MRLVIVGYVLRKRSVSTVARDARSGASGIGEAATADLHRDRPSAGRAQGQLLHKLQQALVRRPAGERHSFMIRQHIDPRRYAAEQRMAGQRITDAPCGYFVGRQRMYSNHFGSPISNRIFIGDVAFGRRSDGCGRAFNNVR